MIVAQDPTSSFQSSSTMDPSCSKKRNHEKMDAIDKSMEVSLADVKRLHRDNDRSLDSRLDVSDGMKHQQRFSSRVSVAKILFLLDHTLFE